MSGICGICEPGRELGASSLGPMLNGLALPGESARDACGGNSIALGVAQRWDFQQVAAVNGIIVAADADLVDFSGAAEALSMTATAAAAMPVAELIARLYLKCGKDLLRQLHGGFSLALWDGNARRLLLAVDRMGIRSLYFRRENDRLLFASRAGAIR